MSTAWRDRVEPWPEEGLENVPNCPICGCAGRSRLHEGLVDNVFFCAPGAWTLYRCATCGAGYLDPRPDEKSIGLAYRSYLTHETQKEWRPGRLGRLKALKRALANGYRNAEFGTSYKPAIRMGAPIAKCFPGYRRILDSETRCLMRYGRAGRVLDIGCGNGDFLELAQALGWQADGIDPDPKAVDVAVSRGLPAVQGNIDCLNQKNGQYDAITLSHVIEHVHDPGALLSSCHRLLKPDGFLWLETPNLESIGHAEYGRSWRGLETPRHLVLFNFEAMQQALSNSGYVAISVELPTTHCRHLFAASEAIQRGLDPKVGAKLGFRGMWLSLTAQRRGRRDPSVREFITLTAKKKQQS